VMAIPALDLRLALPDNGSAAKGTSQRAAYDEIAHAFGPGFNGPLVVLVRAVDTAGPYGQRAAGQVARQIKAMDDVIAVGPPQYDQRTGDAIIQVIPHGGPHDQSTPDLVQAIRSSAPALKRSTHTEVYVTGSTAVGIDVSDRLRSSLPTFAAVVVGLSLVLLLVVFRSLVIPVKATLGFLMSVAASFAAVVAVFQWGWLSDVFGVSATGPVVSFLPVILMGVLFGLAMDYEVFLVSGIREEWTRTGLGRESVVGGARQASRVVTAAAAIMFSVFASFVTSDDAIVKPIAFSLAFGVLVDAFLVRMTFVPAVLVLVGRGAWWLPGWLDRLLPTVNFEGEGGHGGSGTRVVPTPAPNGEGAAAPHSTTS